jgi:hypothetical protein
MMGSGFISDPGREARVLRDRYAALSRALDNTSGAALMRAMGRFAGSIYNGGMMPATGGKIFLTNPVRFTGTEGEGNSQTQTIDTSTSIPVYVIGTTAPNVGDVLDCYSVGGRWVAERGAGSGGGGITCNPCAIPATDLTISWTNLIGGPGSTTLTYNPGFFPDWESGCALGLIYELLCSSTEIELRVIYFLSGSCPDGETAYCSNIRTSPFGLTLASYSCSPFSLTFEATLDSCPALVNDGFQSWTVTL